MDRKIVLHIISNLSSGGAEGALYRLIQHDKKYRHIVVSLMDGGVYSKKMIEIGADVHIISMPRGKVTIQGLIKLYKVIKKSHADIIQTWMYHADLLGGLLAKLAGHRNIIWGIRCSFDKKRASLSTKVIIKFCSLFSYWLPKKIVSNSYFAKNTHIVYGYSAKKFVVIDNGYSSSMEHDLNQYKSELTQNYNIKNNVPVLGMVARFDPYKDHQNIFAALSLIAKKNIDFSFLFVGSGMVESNKVLVEAIEKYNIRNFVNLLGPYDNVPAIMSFIDIHILSSASESFPNVLAEAMILGTPCVSTEVGDAKRIIDDTGWLVPAENPQMLANGIEQALFEMQNLNNWKIRQKDCKERIKNNYSMNKMTSSFNDLWASLT